MPDHDLVDRDRRAVLGAGGVLMLGAALWPRARRRRPTAAPK